MLNLCSAVLVSIVNMVYAATIYLSLHGWIVQHEPSGMQLIVHILITTPVIVITTIWLYLISKAGRYSAKFWKVNLASLLVPIISIQTGVTYYHYDKVGLAATLLISIALIPLLICEVQKNARN